MPEQRRFIRYDTEGFIILNLLDGTSRSINAELVDVSFTGIRICAKEKIEAGIDVNFELRSQLWSEPIIGKGKIEFAQEINRNNTKVFRMGIKFLDVNEKIIEYFINRVYVAIRAKMKKKSQKRLPPEGEEKNYHIY
jgi:c-di-GMP-binding flagellar brake protein YcgR